MIAKYHFIDVINSIMKTSELSAMIKMSLYKNYINISL